MHAQTVILHIRQEAHGLKGFFPGDIMIVASATEITMDVVTCRSTARVPKHNRARQSTDYDIGICIYWEPKQINGYLY